MVQDFTPIPDNLFALNGPPRRPKPARRRFQPTLETEEILKECERMNLDISTIINIGITHIRPSLRPCGATWEGIKAISGN